LRQRQRSRRVYSALRADAQSVAASAYVSSSRSAAGRRQGIEYASARLPRAMVTKGVGKETRDGRCLSKRALWRARACAVAAT